MSKTPKQLLNCIKSRNKHRSICFLMVSSVKSMLILLLFLTVALH